MAHGTWFHGELQCQYYLPVMRKKRVRMTRRVNPPTAAVAMTRICPCSAAISEAGKKKTPHQIEVNF